MQPAEPPANAAGKESNLWIFINIYSRCALGPEPVEDLGIVRGLTFKHHGSAFRCFSGFEQTNLTKHPGGWPAHPGMAG